MNILRIASSVDPAQACPPAGMHDSALAMAGQGHSIELVTLDDPSARFLPGLPFQVHPLGRTDSPRLEQWIAEHASRFDAAIIDGLWNYAAVNGGRGAQKAELPYVVYAHGMMAPSFRSANPAGHLARRLFWWAAQGRVLRDAEAVLFTSEEERRLARGTFGDPNYKEQIVTFGAAVPHRPYRNGAIRFATILGDRPYLLFLGRLNQRKGCDLLIEAFAELVADHPDLCLVIAGPDGDGISAPLRRLAAERGVGGHVIWPGPLDGEAKWAALRGAEALVLPSHQDNFGIVVAEAMACATPVLISNRVNIWREVEATGGGLVEPDTVAGTALLLRRFLALSERERKKMGLAARRGYEGSFSVEKAAADLLAVLEQVAHGGH